MSETQKELFPDIEQANEYIESVRELYRNGEGMYQGRRNEEQQAIAELTADEARELVDGTMAGILAVTSGVTLPKDYEAIETGGHTWRDFRGEYTRLLVGFGVITNRLNRDGYSVPSYIELSDGDRVKVASSLFGDFLAHNGLRFDVDSSGVMKTHRQHTAEGEIELTRTDLDKAKGNKEIQANMRTRGFSSGIATHAAGKISTDEYRKLRREFPEIDKDEFDQLASSSRNFRKTLESRGE